MKWITHNDLWFAAISSHEMLFQGWVIAMPLDMDFEWSDGPLDAPA